MCIWRIASQELGFSIGWGFWLPQSEKIELITKANPTNRAEMTSFLGSVQFYRRHLKGCVPDTAYLNSLTTDDTDFSTVDVKRLSEALNKVKTALLGAVPLGAARPIGEFLVVTDACDIGGGGGVWQWQSRTNEEWDALTATVSLTVERDGSITTLHPESVVLVPLGFYSWKWAKARMNYSTWEQEALAGTLVLAVASPSFAGNKVVCLCDQKALESFW